MHFYATISLFSKKEKMNCFMTFEAIKSSIETNPDILLVPIQSDANFQFLFLHKAPCVTGRVKKGCFALIAMLKYLTTSRKT